ncbi:MAG TPA: tetratricopeptide repeat-containing sensor histidine kinase [Ohtaekwangia sp.]
MLFFSAKSQNADQPVFDSLQQELRKATSDQRKIDIQNAIALQYYNVDLKKSLNTAQEAFDKSKYIEYDKGMQQSLSVLMRVNRRLGNFSIAIEYNLAKLPIAERLHDTLDLIDSYSSLGNIYSSLERYEESGRYLRKAYTMGKEVGAANLGSIMNFIGRSYGKEKKYDSATFWIRKAMKHELASPQPGYTLSYIYNNLAEIHYFIKHYDSATYYYQQSLGLPDNHKSAFGITFTLNGLASIYKEQKDFSKAIAYAQKGLQLAEKNSYRDRIKDAYRILHEVYEAKGEFYTALQYYKLFNLYQDSIFSEDKLQYIENLKLTHETNRIERENELLKKDAELKDARLREQRSLAWGSVLVIGSLSVLSFILYINFRQKKKTNTLLSNYNSSLEAQVDERTQELVQTNLELVRQNNQLEQFGYIIAHNLRAPVARILGLTNLIKGPNFSLPSDRIVLDKLQVSAEDLDTIIHDLNSILEIKKGVHHSFESIQVADRFSKVKHMLKDKISESKAILHENLKVDTRCYGIPAYIESILYNLLSNAIKYRSPDRNLEIKIHAEYAGEYLKVVIEDNGIGMDLQRNSDRIFNLYQRFHDHVEGKGIGLFLVKTQIESLNGTIDLDSEVDRGTKFTIGIPRRPVEK